MRRDFKSLILLSVAVIAFLGSNLYIRKSSQQRVEEFINEARANSGNLNEAFNNQNFIGFKLDSLIKEKDYARALAIIDTASISEAFKANYMGVIFFNQGKVRASLEYFTKAINLDNTRFSKAVAYRAKAYYELNIFDSAILDYKNISIINYDYYQPLAETYQRVRQKDSAIKYYQMFFKQYPDSVVIGEKIKRLKNGG